MTVERPSNPKVDPWTVVCRDPFSFLQWLYAAEADHELGWLGNFIGVIFGIDY